MAAIIEHIDGRRVVHHGREFVIMTNDPPYDEQFGLRLTSAGRSARSCGCWDRTGVAFPHPASSAGRRR